MMNQDQSYGAFDHQSVTSSLDPNLHHDNQYFNSELHNPLFNEAERSGEFIQEPVQTHGVFRRRSIDRACCLFAPIYAAMQSVYHAESLHRSFCYGAIDGMLTGSGIVSSFRGLGLLSVSSSRQIRTLVVAFSVTACSADAICMGLGHIWSTHVMNSVHADERRQARSHLSRSKAEAKGQLVDMLLDKGMLKIDAMSMADTLEGYPDLFVSVMTGDALTNSFGSRSPSRLGDLSAGQVLFEHDSDASQSQFWGRLSAYSRIAEMEQEVEPESRDSSAAVSEAQRESLFMTLGFASFAVIPSLLYWLSPHPAASSRQLLNGILNNQLVSEDSATISSNGMMQPESFVISIAVAVMWCLGVWKSRFVDSNWVLFGIETVAVLLICVGVAFCLGCLLNKWLLPDFVLKVVEPSTET